jgi:hypothetical protein
MNNSNNGTTPEQTSIHLPVIETASMRLIVTPKSQIAKTKTNAGTAKPRIKITAPTTEIKSLVIKLSVNVSSLRQLQETGKVLSRRIKRRAAGNYSEEATPLPTKVVKRVHFTPPDASLALPSQKTSRQSISDDSEAESEDGPAREDEDHIDDDCLPPFGDNHIPKRYKAIHQREVQHRVEELEARFQGLST